MSTLEFQKSPSTPWFKLLFTSRNKLNNGQSIPKIEAFWRNVSIDNIDEYNQLCHFQGKALPITYPQVLATPIHMQLLADKRFPLPALGLVHLSQQIEYHHPIELGEVFTIHSWVDGHEQVSKGVQFHLHTEIHRQEQLCWQARSTIFSRAAKGHNQKNIRPIEPTIAKDSSVKWELPENLGRKYTTVSGDFNPIHLYSWTAKPFGFPRHIIHGMWTMARAIATFSQPITKVQTYFIRPVFLPSSALFHSHSDDQSGAFILSNPQNGKTHIWGTIEF